MTPEEATKLLAGLPETHSLRRLPSGWSCPACGRSPIEIIRLTPDGRVANNIMTHSQTGTAICNDCVNVQGDLKARRSGDWWLTINEISSLIRPRSHQKHELDIEVFSRLPESVFERVKGKAVRQNDGNAVLTSLRRLPDIRTWRKEVYHISPMLDFETSSDWRCPCCDRTKFETVRWFEADEVDDLPAGFRLSLTRHHDHAASETKIVDGRFPVTTICEDCNGVDATVKVRCAGLPRLGWSFSPDEIKRVIRSRSHQRHYVDLKLGRAIAMRILIEKKHAKLSDN